MAHKDMQGMQAAIDYSSVEEALSRDGGRFINSYYAPVMPGREAIVISKQDFVLFIRSQ